MRKRCRQKVARLSGDPFSPCESIPSDAQGRWLGFLGPLQLSAVRTLSRSWRRRAESENLWRPFLNSRFPNATSFVLAGCVEDKAMPLYLQQCRLTHSMTASPEPSASEFKVVVDIFVSTGRKRVISGCFGWEASVLGDELIVTVPAAVCRLPISEEEAWMLKISLTVVHQVSKKCLSLCHERGVLDVYFDDDPDGGYILFDIKNKLNGHWPLVQSIFAGGFCPSFHEDMMGDLNIRLMDLSWAQGADGGDLLKTASINISMHSGTSDFVPADKFLAAMTLGDWVK